LDGAHQCDLNRQRRGSEWKSQRSENERKTCKREKSKKYIKVKRGIKEKRRA
jgi:hypothetical protein